ncbi:YtxH domain-containing protein [Virgibacillus sp. SK37]|uniref:YtxH domain-containing protein n=1 Tax=Virgibacillus sp. SK37 TaxID=403957 RepID=UPI0004D1658E|nr:YtxH domain-containing protein [Virgibacillus sp. SK37]AIF44636.1 hypothetical protein X953_17135 [Virgibacillus sp. SK37]
MTKQTANQEQSNNKGFLSGTIFGIMIGLLTAIFLTPKSGKELRGDFVYQAGSVKDKALTKKSDIQKATQVKLSEIKENKIMPVAKSKQNNNEEEKAASPSPSEATKANPVNNVKDSEQGAQLQADYMQDAKGNEAEDTTSEEKPAATTPQESSSKGKDSDKAASESKDGEKKTKAKSSTNKKRHYERDRKTKSINFNKEEHRFNC